MQDFLLWLKSRLSAITEQVFAAPDAHAHRHGWQVAVTHGPWLEAPETRASTTSRPARHVMAVAAIPMARPALHATGQAAEPWIQPLFRSSGEDDHDSGTSPVSRQPRTHRPTPPHLRRRAQPYGRRLEMALRDSPGVGTGCLFCRCDQLVGRCASNRCNDHRRSGDPVLAARPAVRNRPCLVHHYSASSARRLRGRADLLQPRQDSHHPMDITPGLRRTSLPVLPCRHHR